MKFEQLSKEAIYPTRGTPMSAGHDIYCTEGGVIPARGSKIFPTGITLVIQTDEVLKLASRSGLAFKHDITAFHGTIDCDYYPNEIKVKLFNFSDEPFEIKAGDKIVQGLISKVVIDRDAPVIKMQRDGGFGHTGE